MCVKVLSAVFHADPQNDDPLFVIADFEAGEFVLSTDPDLEPDDSLVIPFAEAQELVGFMTVALNRANAPRTPQPVPPVPPVPPPPPPPVPARAR